MEYMISITHLVLVSLQARQMQVLEEPIFTKYRPEQTVTHLKFQQVLPATQRKMLYRPKASQNVHGQAMQLVVL